MSEAETRAWSDLIRRRCGLTVRDSQVPLLSELLEERTKARGLPDPGRYFELLEAEPAGAAEWAEVVDRLVSHETSFFRHAPSFEALRARVLHELRDRPDIGAAPLSLWSAGCSTGQEAYSLAMTAAVAALGEFTVWGADISRVAIETARRGRYSHKAVESVPDQHRSRFLRPIAQGSSVEYEVTSDVRERVRFVNADLYSACSMGLTHDVIVCQNVLIYFAPSAVPQMVSMLGGRLSLGGYLFLGPGEAVDCPPGLAAVTVGGVRAFRRMGRMVSEVRP